MGTPPAHSLDHVEFGEVEHCQALQDEELEVLQSIFPEYIYRKKSDGIIKLEIPIEFAASQVVDIAQAPNSPNAPLRADRIEKITVSVLPPLILHICLPPSYPAFKYPDIMSLQATHHWLDDVEHIKQSLIKIHRPGEHTLYNWIEYLRQGEFLLEKKTSGYEEESIGLFHQNPELLASTLSDFETSYKSIRFSQNSYPCSICLTYLKGSKCLRLQCSHIFCRECLEDCWKMWIKEGNVSKVGCPDPDCVKEGKESCEEEVAMIVTSSELERWRILLKRRDLERGISFPFCGEHGQSGRLIFLQDPSTVRCPMKQCQNSVPKPKGVDPDSNWIKYRQCSRCAFAFCVLCKFTWHGPLTSCPSSYRHNIAQQYLATRKDSEERRQLESRYRQSFLKRVATQYKEEQSNDRCIASSTTQCPGCKCFIQKSEGCNHMRCVRCTQHFCYLCGNELDASSPYAHFSVGGSHCFKRLFDMNNTGN